jgi:hypothetical protein
MSFMITALFFMVLGIHANPLRSDTETLDIAPDFMLLQICPEGRPLVNCFNPQLGFIYGETADKPVYGANPGVGTDLETAITFSPVTTDTTLRKRGQDYYLDCGDRGSYNTCAAAPHDSHCDASGQLTTNQPNSDCQSDCRCYKLSAMRSCVVYQGGCFDLDGRFKNAALKTLGVAEAEAESTTDATDKSDEPVTTTILTKTKTKRVPQVHWNLNCGDQEQTRYCQWWPRWSRCDSQGRKLSSKKDDACRTCGCQSLIGGSRAVDHNDDYGDNGSCVRFEGKCFVGETEGLAVPAVPTNTKPMTMTLTKRAPQVTWYIDCGPWETTRYCQMYPRNNSCDSKGRRQWNLKDPKCRACMCRSFINED